MWYGYYPNATKFASLECTHDPVLAEWNRIEDLCGRLIGENWIPPTVRPTSKTKSLGDVPLLWYGHPIFSERALETLSRLLGDAIEPLPLKIADDMFYFINILGFVDCLDLEQSRFIRNAATGNISSVQHYVFRDDALPGHHMFLIPELRRRQVFVSASFREKAESAGLVGLYYMELR